jgi:iron complex transport system substrate-binding protein
VIPRIVSLLPSATEIVCALGFADAVVGRSHECDYPAEVVDLPICTAPKVGGATSREIHESVGALLRTETSVYTLDRGLLRELDPTHVVTQIQCEVCAVSLRDVAAALAEWSGTSPQIVTLNPESLHQVFADIRTTAAALGVAARGDRLVDAMHQRMAAVHQAVANRAPLRVAAVEWMDPLMYATNWMPDLLALAGGVPSNLQDADVILVMPCGFDMDDIRRDWHLLTANEAWPSDRRVYIADGNQYFNRPGPRLADSVEILGEILHGLEFGHGEAAWRQCSG